MNGYGLYVRAGYYHTMLATVVLACGHAVQC